MKDEAKVRAECENCHAVLPLSALHYAEPVGDDPNDWLECEGCEKANAEAQPMKQGTEWTEPGQGATFRDFWVVLFDQRERDTIDKLDGRVINDWSYRTDLRLTGAPLTAEDLKRIAECK